MSYLDAGSLTTRRHGALGRDVASLVFALVTCACAIVSFSSAYGGSRYLLVGGVGIVLATVVPFALGRLRQPAWSQAAAVVAAVLVFSGITTPGSEVAGVLPTLSTLHALTSEAVAGWRQLLSVTPPVGSAFDLLVLPYLLGATCAGAAFAIGKTRLAQAAVVPPLLLLLLGIAFGSGVPPAEVFDAVVLGLVSLAWISAMSRSTEVLNQSATSSRVLAGLTLALSGVIAVPLSAYLPGSAGNRFALRQHVAAPFDADRLPSPLGGLRQYVVREKYRRLFLVSGLPAHAWIRIATLDAYDGVVYGTDDSTPTSSGLLYSVGSTLSSVPCPSEAGCETANLSVRIQHFAGPWVPDDGELQQVSYSGPRQGVLATGFRYSETTGAALETGGLEPGDVFSYRVQVPRLPRAATLNSATAAPTSLPSVGTIPAIIRKKAQALTAGAASDFERAADLANWLHKGVFSNGQPGQQPALPGHYLQRLDEMLAAPQPIGDAEQFSALMALMARSVGLPARVVVGVQGPADGGEEEVTGRMVTAWVEIHFDGVGWYPFDPTPTNEHPTRFQSVTQQKTPPPQSLSQAVAASGLGTNVPSRTSPSKASARRRVPRLPGAPFPLATVLSISLPLALLFGAAGAVLLAKESRRRRRMRGSPRARILGGWNEALSVAQDLGAMPDGTTRLQVAQALGGRAIDLARSTDRATFGPDEPGEEDASTHWTVVADVVGWLRSEVPLRRRLWGRLTPRSLLTRSKLID